jgi:ribosomal-protein-alanine N-acetyltransferase
MTDDGLPYIIEPMRLRDVEEVMSIENRTFSLPWSTRAYRYELQHNALSHYFIARQRQVVKRPVLLTRLHPSLAPSPVVGYGGFWLIDDEAHISTLAVKPGFRGRGLGELLLVAMLDRAMELGTTVATLEVRVSNLVAQNLYRKYGFQQVGVRHCYYSNNGEDALIMTVEDLTGAAFRSRYRRLKEALKSKLMSRQKSPLEVK